MSSHKRHGTTRYVPLDGFVVRHVERRQKGRDHSESHLRGDISEEYLALWGCRTWIRIVGLAILLLAWVYLAALLILGA